MNPANRLARAEYKVDRVQILRNEIDLLFNASSAFADKLLKPLIKILQRYANG